MGNYLIKMPDVGEGIAEVEIVEWSVQVGDTIVEDDLLCVVMTDKATVEIPSPVDGEVTWTGPEAGATMAVGADLVRLQVSGPGNIAAETRDGQTASAADQHPPTSHPNDPAPVPEPAPGVAEVPPPTPQRPAPPHDANPPPAVPRPEGEKPIASPAVRQRAREAGIDLRQVPGSGPARRISHADLDAFIANHTARRGMAAGPIADTSVSETKVIGLRRKIAAIMQDTMQRIPHYTYVEEVDVTELELLRARMNDQRRDDQQKLTMLPFFIRAMVKALRAFPQMGSCYDDENEILRQYGAAHIGIATQTPAGLLVPVIRHAETLDVWQAATEVKRLAEAARAGTIGRDELRGSNITITSLGPLGGIATTPVINSPEVAIVGINKVAKRPLWQNGGFVPRDIMHLSSSFDHRIIDGWEATQFIQCIRSLLECPAMLFVEAA
ncbi:2-oxo acid dehydrogenase subunit E2 [Seongchinamella sediminis]|uniref:Dihydrolipoamide acetyltransferase component of pyruvate dehydrogenase complex n=2 Tax=Halieaceae TaxID=1706372 RepID=A0A2N5X5Z4_9GAMM|nr:MULTISPECIES: dihydrolipoamide acetyltransferase family protein [Halieaceae]PLW69897.1 branched-chain alpha-keto acid dehydrogenase subunit E2 [Pseudohalioglobus lutimaris]RLQ20539.1 2-oxo acid dehydrogenase subunit E2 [Seongchinamella sediminis]